MLNVDSITKGVVIDHIEVGKGMDIYNHLKLDELDCSVAVILNVKSAKRNRKDIIKIEDRIDLDMDVLGYLDPCATVNIIEDDKISQKLNLSLPEQLVNVIKCKNPRCVTTSERDIDHVFELIDHETRTYRCAYCEQEQQ